MHSPLLLDESYDASYDSLLELVLMDYQVTKQLQPQIPGETGQSTSHYNMFGKGGGGSATCQDKFFWSSYSPNG